MNKYKSIVIIVAILIVIGFIAVGAILLNKQKSKTNSPVINNFIVKTIQSNTLGNYLAEPNGQALYTYNQDGFNKTNCTGSCLSLWPGYYSTKQVSGLPINFSLFKRQDNGLLQYSYKGHPLYTFKSEGPNQATGNGIGGFYLARP